MQHSKTVIVPRLGTATPATNARVYNPTNGTLNIPVGGFGIYTNTNLSATGNWYAVSTVPASITLATVPFFKFIHRADVANVRSPLRAHDFILAESYTVSPNTKVTVTAKAASTPIHGSFVIGDTTGSGISEVNIEDETYYHLQARIDGLGDWERRNGYGNSKVYHGEFTTPDYTTHPTYTTNAQRRDHLLQNLVYSINGYEKMAGI